jgi:hypothetical protein
MSKIRLYKMASKEATAALAAETLRAGGLREIGGKMADGTVYAGVSPDTKKAMYVPPADVSGPITFAEAKQYAGALNAHGYDDWRLPTQAELKVLFDNRTAIGGFNQSGHFPTGWYWSLTPCGDNDQHACGQRFSDGFQDHYSKMYKSSLRCVRCPISGKLA